MPDIEYVASAPNPQRDRTLVLEVISARPGKSIIRQIGQSPLATLKRGGSPKQRQHWEATVDRIDEWVEKYRNSLDFDKIIVVNHPDHTSQ